MLLAKLSLWAGRLLSEVEGSGNKAADGLLTSIQNLLFDGWVKTLVLTGVGLFAVIKGVMLGIGIVQAADNESERAAKVKGLKNMIIGVAIVIVLYFAAEYIVGLIATGADKKSA